MKKLLLIIPTLTLLLACGSRDAAQNSVNSALESAIESQTGQKVDFADVGSFENNATKASFVVAGEEKITGKTKLTGTVTGGKDNNGKMVSFQFVDEEGTMIMVVISKIPENFSLPFTTKMYKQNEAPDNTHSGMVTFIKASENSMYSYLSFDGTITVTDLNEEKVAFKITGRTGDAMDLEKPENWKEMKADFTITSPIIQTIGFDKKEILR